MKLKSWLALSFVLAPTLSHAANLKGEDLLTHRSVEIAPGPKGTVAVFMSARCPCSDSHRERLQKLKTDFAELKFVVIHANRDEGTELSETYFRRANLDLPVLEDVDLKLATHFQASRTPHAFVIAPDGKLLYRGGITNSANGRTASEEPLRAALEDVRAGRPVKVASARALGCGISRTTSHAQ